MTTQDLSPREIVDRLMEERHNLSREEFMRRFHDEILPIMPKANAATHAFWRRCEELTGSKFIDSAPSLSPDELFRILEDPDTQRILNDPETWDF